MTDSIASGRTVGLATVLWFVLASAAWVSPLAAGSDEIPAIPIDENFSRAGGRDDVVLEVRVCGGFGKILGHVFRLCGDGRLEEALTWSDNRAGTVPVRELPFSAETRDRFLRALVEAGVPGATHDSLVAELKTRDSRYKDLVWSPDCPQVHWRLSLFERKEPEQAPSEVVTELSLSCTH